MMLGEESASADYWKLRGDEALAHGINGVIIMVSSSASMETQNLVVIMLNGTVIGRTLGIT